MYSLTPCGAVPPSEDPLIDSKHIPGEKSVSGTAVGLALNCCAIPFGFQMGQISKRKAA